MLMYCIYVALSVSNHEWKQLLKWEVPLTTSRIQIECQGKLNTYKLQKQPNRGVLWKRYSENKKQIYRRTPKPKCDFNKVTLHLYWNHTLAWVFSCIFIAYFRPLFYKSTSGGLLLKLSHYRERSNKYLFNGNDYDLVLWSAKMLWHTN